MPGEAPNPLAAPSVSGRHPAKGSRSRTNGSTIWPTTAGIILCRPVEGHPPPAGNRFPLLSTRRGGTPSSPRVAGTTIRTRGLVAGTLCQRPPAGVGDSNPYPIKDHSARGTRRLAAAGPPPRPQRRCPPHSRRKGAHRSMCSHLQIRAAPGQGGLTPPPAQGPSTPPRRSSQGSPALSTAWPRSCRTPTPLGTFAGNGRSTATTRSYPDGGWRLRGLPGCSSTHICSPGRLSSW